MHSAETMGSLFMGSMAEGFFGPQKLQLGGVDMCAPAGLVMQGYGLYQTLSGAGVSRFWSRAVPICTAGAPKAQNQTPDCGCPRFPPIIKCLFNSSVRVPRAGTPGVEAASLLVFNRRFSVTDSAQGIEGVAEPRGLVRSRRIEVSWGDCDAAGVVFYPRYYEWFDACTHALLSSVGLDHHALRRVHGMIGTPLVQASATFQSPATFGDVIVAESRIARVGERGFSVRHRLSIGERVVVEGEESRVWARASESAPQRLQAVSPGPEIKLLLEGA